MVLFFYWGEQVLKMDIFRKIIYVKSLKDVHFARLFYTLKIIIIHHSTTCVEKSDFTIPRQVSRSCMAVSSSLWAIPESLLKISGQDNLLLLLPLGLGLQRTKEEATSLVARWQCPANCNLRDFTIVETLGRSPQICWMVGWRFQERHLMRIRSFV